jgi:hypothetical protein
LTPELQKAITDLLVAITALVKAATEQVKKQ